MSAAFGEVVKGQISDDHCGFAGPSSKDELQVVRDQASRRLGHKTLMRAVHSQPGSLYIETSTVSGTQQPTGTQSAW